MFEIMPETDATLLAIRVSGTLSKADYARFNPWLDEQLVRHPRPAMVVDLRGFHGWDGPGAVLEDARLGIAHRGELRRIAMVGGSAWLAWLAALFAPFMKAELRSFDRRRPRPGPGLGPGRDHGGTMKADAVQARPSRERIAGLACPSWAVSASIGQKYSCGWGTWWRAKPS